MSARHIAAVVGLLIMVALGVIVPLNMAENCTPLPGGPYPWECQ